MKRFQKFIVAATILITVSATNLAALAHERSRTDSLTTDPSSASIFESVRVIGLGEATQGQRESFAFRRRVTLYLIREQGFRLGAYEANTTGAKALNDYFQGHSDNMNDAMSGFGMMICMVKENFALLNDLRAWHQEAARRI